MKYFIYVTLSLSLFTTSVYCADLHHSYIWERVCQKIGPTRIDCDYRVSLLEGPHPSTFVITLSNEGAAQVFMRLRMSASSGMFTIGKSPEFRCAVQSKRSDLCTFQGDSSTNSVSTPIEAITKGIVSAHPIIITYRAKNNDFTFTIPTIGLLDVEFPY